MFSFVKQQFYFKTLAYTNYEKNKKLREAKKRKGCCSRKSVIEQQAEDEMQR